MQPKQSVLRADRDIRNQGTCNILFATLEVGHAGKQIKSFGDVIHKQESTHKVPKSAPQTVPSRMPLTLHATRQTPLGALRLV